MPQLIMMISLVLSALLLGFSGYQGVVWISRHVGNKLRACTYSCLLGTVLILVILILAYLVIPAVARAVTGNAIHVGVIV